MEKNLADKIIYCKDCRKKFVFTIGEQKWFGVRGWKDPVRCKECRRHKKLINLALDENVPISDKLKFSDICNKCGKRFYTTIKRKKDENLYCQDCWTEIKFGGSKRQGVDKREEKAR